ncbi:ectoine hydroxylase [Tomitella fengzijianii]|uniref:Ectoine hydroxylase n=1 Tax=Tomitella fengzijianii TaxID=2597660 RepID=A0A516X5Y3_9ACTN|nr:ectoine hydroxylase [Tomitella fengzijianii]
MRTDSQQHPYRATPAAPTGRVPRSRIADRYPTRSSACVEPGGRVRWIDRPHSVVWSEGRDGAADGPLSAGELRGHEEKGYTVVPGLLSPAEVQQYWSELERLTGDPALVEDHRVVREPGSGAIRSIFEVHRISGMISGLARDPRVLGAARQILGSDVYIHQSRINYMPGFEGNGFYWHSDFETWHAEDGLPTPRAVSLSIALTDNYPFNGGLMVMPGSHRHFVPGQGETPSDNHRRSLVMQNVGVPGHDDVTELAAEYGIDQFTGAAGAGLWFDSNIMHGSGNNITPYPRSNIFLVFNSVDNAPVDPFEAEAPRPAHIAARDTTPIPRRGAR